MGITRGTSDAGATTTYIGNSILIMKNSYSGAGETRDTKYVSKSKYLSLVTIFILSCFILERFILQVKVVNSLFNLESLFYY